MKVFAWPLCYVVDHPRRLPLEGKLACCRFSLYDSLALINCQPPAPVWLVGVQAQGHPTSDERASDKMAATTPAAIDEDWEEWTPEKGSFLHHMMAGSAAGVAEHVSIFPIDTIKVSNERVSLVCVNGVCVCMYG